MVPQTQVLVTGFLLFATGKIRFFKDIFLHSKDICSKGYQLTFFPYVSGMLMFFPQ